MRESTERGTSFGQAVSGFAAIVIGVLVALAAETWWEERAETRRDLENFALLERELAAVDSTLAAVVSVDSATAAGLVAGRAALARGDSMPTDGLNLQIEDYRISTGAARRLLADPGPLLIENPGLHTRVSDFLAELDATRELNSMLTQTALDAIGAIFVAQESDPGFRAPDAMVRAEAMRSSPEFLGGITMWLVALENREQLHRGLIELVEGTRGELGRILEERR